MNIILEIIIVNIPVLIAVLFALFYVPNIAKHKLFIIGLITILTSGVFAIPYSSWLFKNHSNLIADNEIFLTVSTLPVGLIHMVGLFLCTVAFAKEVGGAESK
ncbi:MAG: hypothetical protein GYB30_10635 [Gammaproteobacteria bacterium]|nr:hypothetical protein [Gammaproteobacteria bacterium]